MNRCYWQHFACRTRQRRVVRWALRKMCRTSATCWIDWVVIDPVRRAKSQSTVCAAHEHHIGCASARRQHTRQHINVIVSRAARAINRQEQHPIQTCRIYPTTIQVAAHIDVLGYVVKGRCLAPNLRVARANAGKGVPFAADKKIAVGIHIERPVCRLGLE